MVSPAFWFGLCVTIVMAVLPDILGTIISRQFTPTNIQKAQVGRRVKKLHDFSPTVYGTYAAVDV